MQDYGYCSHAGIQCVFLLNDIGIKLIPCNPNDSFSSFPVPVEPYLLELTGAEGMRGTVFKHTALVDQTYYTVNGTLELEAKYIFSRYRGLSITGFDIYGDGVDEMFFLSPCPHPFDNNVDGTFDALNDIIGSWEINFLDNIVHISLLYANTLSFCGKNALEFRPILRVEVPGSEDLSAIYKLYSAIINFIKLIRYRSSCGNMEVKLNNTPNGSVRIGSLNVSTSENSVYVARQPIALFEFWKPYIQNLLQFSVDHPELSLLHFPSLSLRHSKNDYTPIAFSQIFTAFENECHCNKALYEKVENKSTEKIKKSLLSLIEESAKSDMASDELQFLSKAKGRISELDTAMGQGAKILRSFSSVYHIIEQYIPFITTTPKEEIEKKLKEIPSIRGKILHDGSLDAITDDNVYTIRILELIVFCQTMRRAYIDDNDISRIIGVIFQFNEENSTFLAPN